MHTKNRFEVIALHPWTECNMDCSFCYKKKSEGKQKDPEFFYELIPYLKKYAGQVAIGGGEPFYYPKRIKKLTKLCQENNMIANITSNGTLLQAKTDEELAELLKYVTMLSVSFDREKIRSNEDVSAYLKLIGRINKLDLCLTGCNLLIDEQMMKNPLVFIIMVTKLLEHVDRVFALYPKNFKGPDILKPAVRGAYYYLTAKEGAFYVDDLTNQILTQKNYTGWKKPCHYGKIISIDEIGAVRGCSFEKEPLFIMDKPEDIKQIEKIGIPSRKHCPYLIRK